MVILHIFARHQTVKTKDKNKETLFPNPPHVLHKDEMHQLDSQRNANMYLSMICCLPVSTSSTVDRCSRKMLYQHTELSVYPIVLYVDIASSILNPICTFNIKPN